MTMLMTAPARSALASRVITRQSRTLAQDTACDINWMHLGQRTSCGCRTRRSAEDRVQVPRPVNDSHDLYESIASTVEEEVIAKPRDMPHADPIEPGALRWPRTPNMRCIRQAREGFLGSHKKPLCR